MNAVTWEKRLDRWLEPFLAVWGDKRRRKWAPLYLKGLLLPGERKSVTPMASRVAPDDGPQLHHFIADSPWEAGPIERVLVAKVRQLLGGPTAHLIVDDTALPKKGEHSVGVAHQYCGALGKQANCQVLVSLTLANDDVPAPLSLRLFLPESWADDEKRRERARVPKSLAHRPKWQIALTEIDRLISEDVKFGDVLADAGYGACAEFRRGLSERNLLWAVGIASTQNVYACDVETSMQSGNVGRPRTYPSTSILPMSAAEFIELHGRFRKVTWRTGSKGPLNGEFAILRVRPADVPRVSRGAHPPGDEVWLVCERLSETSRKYYLCNFAPTNSARTIVAAVKARWACEQAHQQMKEELGLDHFEARSYTALEHHCLLVMMAFAFLLELRLSENKAAT